MTDERGLTEFLLARIAEDERAARMHTDGGYLVNGDVSAASMQREHELLEAMGPEWASRVLADCEAKRQIVKRLRLCEREGYDNAAAFLHETVADFAAIHADHPDYDESWRP